MEELTPIVPLYLRAHDRSPIRRLAPKMQRNEICKLESIKFKNCCGKNGYTFCVKLLNQYFDEKIKEHNESKSSNETKPISSLDKIEKNENSLN